MRRFLAALLVSCFLACAPIDPKCVVTCMAPQPPCEVRDAGPEAR